MANPYSWGPSGSNTYNYYNPSEDYGAGQHGYGLGDWANTQIGNQYLEGNPEAAFTRYLADNGYRDFTAMGEFARNQYGRVRAGYEAALATNPNLFFTDYLQQHGSGLVNQFRRLTPEQRGETPNQFAPRARYIPR